MNILRARIDFLVTLIFFGVLAYSLWCASVGWGTPIVQQHEFVQAKAAIGAYYIAKGGPIFSYELPVFGPPWSVPMEFPMYQAITAWAANISGVPLNSAGRLVARFFFYLSCIPLFVISRLLGFPGRRALVPLILFLASPIYLFWSRQFMNESLPVFFGLTYVASVLTWEKNQSAVSLLLSLFLGAIAALSKSTTYATFGLIACLILGTTLFRKRKLTATWLLQSAAILLIPLLVGAGWVMHSDHVKFQNPLAADLMTSSAQARWYLYSGWTQFASKDLWNHFFRITIPDSIGHRAAWILSVVFALSLGRKAWLYWLCSLLFLVAPLLFTEAHMRHDYYANANAVFLVFAVSALIERAMSSEKKWRVHLGAVLLLTVLGYEVREFMSKGYFQQQEVRLDQIAFAQKLQGLVPPEQVVLFYGEDWCPVIPYHAERRAIMMSNGRWYNPQLAESLNLLKAEGKKLGAVVLCHEARADKELLSKISLGPIMLKDLCDVYAPRLSAQ